MTTKRTQVNQASGLTVAQSPRPLSPNPPLKGDHDRQDRTDLRQHRRSHRIPRRQGQPQDRHSGQAGPQACGREDGQEGNRCPRTGAAADTKPSADTAPTAVPYEKTGLPEKIAACVKKDRDGVVALLAEFGAKKGSELKPEQYAAFGEKIDALLAPAADLS